MFVQSECDGGMGDILYYNHKHVSLFAACQVWKGIKQEPLLLRNHVSIMLIT